MRLTLAAAELTAADTDERTLTYTLVPYGPVGQTSLGPVTAERGAITVPEQLDRVKLLRGHDRDTPVGHALLVDDTDTALLGSFRVARTPAGDAALLDAAERIRDGVSVELDDVELRDGHLIAGRLIAAAMVALPAWSDARLAAEHEPAPAPPPAAPAAAEQETPPMTTETRTAAPPAREPEQLRAAPATTTRPVSYAHELAQRLLAARMDGGAAQLLAALADVTPDGNGTGNEQAALGEQAMGELWSGSEYELKYLPLVTGGQLTGTEAHGWRWKVPPTVDDYAGNKAPIPTGEAKLEVVRSSAERAAGGHDIDRIYRDLGDAAMLVSYWRLMAEAVRIKYDARALAAILAAAGAAQPPASTTLSEARIRGFFAVDTYARPTFTIAANDTVLAESLTAQLDAKVGPPFTLPAVTPSRHLADGSVVTGARGAVQVLTVNPPIRIEAVNIPNGGIDGAIFGYSAQLIHKPEAVVLNTVTVAPAAASEGRRGK